MSRSYPRLYQVRILASLAVLIVALVFGLVATASAAPAPEKLCSVSGHVTDGQGHAVQGIEVLAWADVVLNDGTSVAYHNTAVTAADGAYKVPDLVPGTYEMSFSDPQGRYIVHGSDFFTVAVDGDVTGADFSGLALSGGVTGRAHDIEDGPVVGAEVSLSSPVSGYWYDDWATTDANGVYDFVNVAVSSYEVYFGDGAGPQGDMLLDSQTGTSVDVVAGQTVAGPDATYSEGGFIRGNTVDGNKAFVVGNLGVNIVPQDAVSGYAPLVSTAYMTDTDWATGSFTQLVRPGTYAVRTVDWNGIYDTATVSGYTEVLAGQTVNVGPIPLYSGRDDVHYITGVVRDADTGNPIPGAEVDTWGWAPSMWGWNWYENWVGTAQDGSYGALVPGASSEFPSGWHYWNWAWAPDHMGAEHSVTVTDADVTDDFVLQSDASPQGNASVSGHITDSQGAPLPNVSVAAEVVAGDSSASGYVSTSGYASGMTDANGDYTLSGLPSSDNVRVVVNSYDGWDEENPNSNRPMVAYHDHPFFPSAAIVSGYSEYFSVSGYDPVEVSDGNTTTGVDQVLPVGGHIRANAISNDGPMGGVDVMLEYKYKGSWMRIGGGGFTTAGVLDTAMLWPGDYRVSYRDIFGRIDGTADSRVVHVSEDQTATVDLVSPSVAETVTLPGGGSAAGSFSGAITAGGTLSVVPTTTIPVLPVGVFQMPGSTYEISYSGNFSGMWTLTLPYDPALPDTLASQIVVQHYNSQLAAWEALIPISVDTIHHTVTIQTTSLSPFALIVPASVVHTADFQLTPTVSETAPYVGASVSIDTTMTDKVTHAALDGYAVRLQSSHDGGSTWTTETVTVSSLGGGKYHAAVLATQTTPIAFRFSIASNPPYFTGKQSESVSFQALPTNTSWVGATLPGGATSVVVPYSGTVALSGTLHDSLNALLDTANSVIVQTSTDGASYADSALLAGKLSAGTYSATVAPKVKTYYRFHFVGDGLNNPSYSAAVVVIPQVKLTAPSGKSTVKARKTFKVTGTVASSHSSRAKTVKVYLERLKGRHYVAAGFAWAKNTSKGSYSIYTASFKLKAGRYRFRAMAPADAEHALTSYTKYLYVRVK